MNPRQRHGRPSSTAAQSTTCPKLPTMPKPKKSRRKPPQKLPRPVRAGNGASRAADSAPVAAMPSIDPRDDQGEEQLSAWGEEAVTGVVTRADSDGVLLDVNGVTGYVPGFELPIPDHESSAQRYTVGDVIKAFSLGVLHDQSALVLSIRRAKPEYADTLDGFEHGDVVQGIVRFATDHLMIADVDGLAGTIGAFHPSLAAGEFPADRLSVDDHVDAIVGWPLSNRSLDLLVVDDLSAYDAAFATHQVGDIVKGYIIRVGSGMVVLDVDGVRGFVQATELPPDFDVAVEDYYTEGEIVEALIVHVDKSRRTLFLSFRRLTPGYADAFAALEVGQSVSGTVIAIAPRTLWMDVDGLISELDADELPIDRSLPLSDLYSVGDVIEGALIWTINSSERGFSLSVRRNLPGYAAQLATYQPGMIVRGIVTEQIGRWLDINGVFGVLAGNVASDRQYAEDEAVEAVVWQVDHDRRMLILAPHDLRDGIGEAVIVPGAKIDAVVQHSGPGGIRVLAENTPVFIPHYALSLTIGGRPRFGPDTVIRVVVVEVGDDGSPKTLSHRRALDGWEQEAKSLRAGNACPRRSDYPAACLAGERAPRSSRPRADYRIRSGRQARQ